LSRTDPLSIRQLEVFVALVEQGSFTKAARHLELSQSTVSGHIADLERRLDVRLVERDRSGVRTTAAGHALLVPAREVLRAELHARTAVQELSGLLRGSVVVGGSTIPSSYLLPRFFARFREAHPGVALRMATGDSAEILERIRAAELEIGVVGSAPEVDGLVSFPCGSDRLLYTVPRNHRLAGKKRVAPEQILEFPIVMREAGSGTRVATENALRSLLGDRVAELEITCEVGSTEALKAAIGAGLGVGFVSDLALGAELGTGVLATVPLTGFEVTRAFHLVSRSESLLSAAARAFRDVVRQSV
jgi:DNA-binding transcriptional LysR family regulator